MQDNPIAEGVPPSGTVQGLGMCDALRVTLRPVQVPWILHALEQKQSSLKEEICDLRDECEATDDRDAWIELEGLEDELYLLQEIGQHVLREFCQLLEARAYDRQVVFAGPSQIVARLIRNTMRQAVHALDDLAGSISTGTPVQGGALREMASAAQQWVATFLDCDAVERFSFEALPHGDPSEPAEPLATGSPRLADAPTS